MRMRGLCSATCQSVAKAHEEVSAQEKFKPKWEIGICLKSYKNREETWQLCVKQKDQHHIVSDCSPDQIKAYKVRIIIINPRRAYAARIYSTWSV